MSDSAWMQRLEGAMGAAAAQSHKTPLRALLVAGALLAVSIYAARDLSLNADLVELLPKSFQSVQDIDKLRIRFGGMGYVVVAGLDSDEKSLKQFADDFAPKLETLPDIRFVEYQRANEFFEKHALYYMELPDLETIASRIDDRIAYERRTRNPLFVNLDEDEAPPSLDFSDIEAKYGGSSSRRLQGAGEKYYYSPDDRIIALLAKPSGSSADLGYAKKLMEQVEGLMAKENLSKYGKDFRWAITGTYKKKVDQQIEITNDLKRASTIALLLLLGYLIFHFRSILAVAFTLGPVFAGLTYTYGYVGAAYGQVNLLTGFLGAILGGLGTEHGIHLLGRYGVLRNEGKTSEEATREAFQHTGGSALISSIVAALTFLTLAISEFRAFREFGIIAAIGMLTSVLSYVLLLPPLLGLATRLGWEPSKHRELTASNSELARWLPKRFRPLAMVVGLLLVVAAVKMPDVGFNYDFSALDDVTLPSVQLDHRINKILGYSQTPVIMLTDTAQAEREAIAKLKQRKQERGKASTVDFIAGIEDLVPPQQNEKQAVMLRINEQLSKISPDALDPESKKGLERALELTKTPPFVREDVPVSVRRQFESATGDSNGFVLVFPAISLADGAAVRRFAGEVREIDLSDGSKLSAAGESMILADILDMVTREAPIVLIAAILSVLLAMWITMGSLKTAAFCMLPTLLSVVALVGVMASIDFRFNYLNILVVPVLIGTTVDAGVHLMSRLSSPGSDFAPVYGETGRAIVGGLITSAVGFGALVLARHPGLNSVGNLANLGFATNLLVILVGFPAFLLLMHSVRTPTETAASEAGAPSRKAEGG